MNLDPNSINQNNEDGTNAIEPSSETNNGHLNETPKDGDFRVQDLSGQIKTPEAERGIPRDLSVRKISTMKKVVILVLGLFSVGLISAGVMRYGAGWFKKEPKTEQTQIASTSGTRHDFSKSQKDSLSSAADVEIVEEVASEPESDIVSEPQPDISSQATTATPTVSEPPPDLRLISPLMFDDVDSAVTGGESVASAGGASAYLGSSSESDTDNSKQQGLAARLNGSIFTPAVAQQRGNLDYLLGRSTGIQCGLLTRIVTTYPGITKCQVLNDVYSANGKVLLVEKGSIIHGEQQSALMQGQARVFAAWTTIETPNGVTVRIDSLGADPLGGSGHPARVNNHFWKRIGGAVMISMIDDIINAYGRRSKNSSENVSFESTTESAQDLATEVLKNTINIPPTGYVNQGERIMVYVARDVDFSHVYEIVPTD
ncbi:type IV secretion system protein VirB10 [Neisseria zalophi]|uniref:TrbI/VirB10 family protein n=1 Tax=Neisseria zalophi TaxID=640030 RepID=A0A5J6PTZ5_9NEIS|nr:type IV secretion system protein VirB10 [Neisseria zalophi]QEY25784.1 TrbI/VirB10 family protein [Neisseria zalophi]